MTVGKLFDEVEVQGLYQLCYYDEEQEERCDLEFTSELMNAEINFIYVEDGILYIEVNA